jgi:tetratricopeptide (TPR) repeat protein
MISRFNRNGYFLRILIFLLLFITFSRNLFTQENDVDNTLNEVARLLAGRDFSSALRLFDRLDSETAENTQILIMKASILNSAGRPAEAIQIANRIVARESNNTEALMILADAAALQGKEADRRNFLERVIGINPGHARALNDLGNLALGARNLVVAAGYFDRALAAEPENGEALVGRAIVYRYNRESRRSEQLLNRAASLYPQWARPLHERARLYRSAGFYDDALEDIDLALQLDPGNYWVIVDRAQVLMDMNRKQEALRDFTRAIEIDPEIFYSYVFSAGIKDETGDYAGAERDYAKLASLRPDYYFAFEAIGVLNMKNKQWLKARDAFLEAYKQAPREFTYPLLAAICWMRGGRQTDPKQFLAQVLRTAPRDSLDYAMLRLFHDLSGDTDVAEKVDKETDINTKARMLFYLASYYDIRGYRNLADRYYLMVQDLDGAGVIEWRLNEWILAEKGLGIRTAQ